jgi:signal transduction histidine kinase/DNA-binding response OmpR family regulator
MRTLLFRQSAATQRIEQALAPACAELVRADDPSAALAEMARSPFSLVVVDAEDGDALTLLHDMRARGNSTTAVAAAFGGATDCDVTRGSANGQRDDAEHPRPRQTPATTHGETKNGAAGTAAVVGPHDPENVTGNVTENATETMTANPTAHVTESSAEDVTENVTMGAAWERDIRKREITWGRGLGSSFGHPITDGTKASSWWEARVHPSDRARVLRSLEHALGADARWSEEYRFLRADGTYADVLDRGAVVRDAAGAATRVVGLMTDITERKRIQSKLLLADRMACVGTLAAGIAHEINNPLFYVLTNVEFALDRIERAGATLGEPERNRLREPLRALAEAKIGAERVRDIVRQLKTFSRGDSGEPSPVDILAVLDAVLRMAENEIRHRARLLRSLEAVPMVDATEARLGQVFLNLLVNATQSMAEGAADQNELCVTAKTDADGWAEVEVRDTGVGIAPEALDHIFDPFFTTKPLGEGTGMGLSICHTIVTSLGGDIHVDSTLGRGTRVRVRLPPSASAHSKGVATPPSRARRRTRVLCIDDEPLLLRALERMVGGDHDVTALTSARDALDRIDRGERYDVVLCDLMMPDMTGMEFFDALLAKDPRLARATVFLTGGAFTPRAQEFLAHVDNLRLDKPFDFAAVDAVIRAAAEERARSE